MSRAPREKASSWHALLRAVHDRDVLLLRCCVAIGELTKLLHEQGVKDPRLELGELVQRAIVEHVGKMGLPSA